MLAVDALTCRLGARPVLRGVSLTVPAGGLVALSGPSGCGKSTLLRVLCGLIERDGGGIALDARPIPPARDRAARREWHRRILLLPQDTSRAFNPVRRLRPQFRDALALHGKGGGLSQRDAIAAHAMHTVALDPASLDRYPAQLSGGQRQRAALARLLCLRPRMLLLDEPSSALDPASALDLLDLIRAVAGADGMGVLIATHDRGLAAMADTALSMHAGAVPAPDRVPSSTR